jgi:drug/metabolite transporter (DMT)-like permease
MTPHQKGLLLTGFGGFILSFDIPLIRLAEAGQWQAQLIRSGLGVGVSFLAWGAISLLRGKAIEFIPGRAGALVALLYGLGAIAFVTAVFHTGAANVVFILSFTTMFSALLAWIAIGERPAPVTLATMFVMVFAVLMIVGDGIRAGSWIGDAMALLTSFIIAVIITVSRRSGRDMGFTPMVGGILPVLVALAVIGSGSGGDTAVAAPLWLFLNGAIVIPIAFWCLATGPKYISGPEVAMFYLIETVLTPVWVWAIFTETPTPIALVGGVIIIVALIAHSAIKLAAERRERQSHYALPRSTNSPRT